MIDDVQKAIAAKYLLTIARQVDEAIVDGGKNYPLVGVGKGRNVTTEFILRCEKGGAVAIDPTTWVMHVMDTIGGDWPEVYAKAVEFWAARGGMPEDETLTKF